MINYFTQCVYAFIACAAFCIVFNIKDFKIAFYASLGGSLAWLAYLLMSFTGSGVFQSLVAAVTAAAFSEIMARIYKTPAMVFLIIGILPMVPGGGIYYTMEYCIKGDTQRFLEMGLQTFAIAGAIAVGVSFSSSIIRIITTSNYLKMKREKNDGNDC